jgi:P4 family phage/plasmid primase-like protien
MTRNADAGQDQPLLDHHRRLLEEGSGIAPAIIAERGYWSATTTDELAALGFVPVQRRVPALVVPRYTTAGVSGPAQIRPDTPRVQKRDGKERRLKYESPITSRNAIDVHPRTVAILGEPSVPLLIGEGIRKGDSAVSHGFHSLNLPGVYGWRGTNAQGGSRTLPDFDDIAINDRRLCIVYDSDGATNPQVQQGATRLRDALLRRHAKAFVLFLPPGLNGEKVGEDDFLVAGGDLAALIAEAEATPSGVFAAALRRYHLTDYGNAERFVAQHRDAVRYCWSAHAWHVWTGTHWDDEARAVIRQKAKATVRRIYREVDLAASDDEAKAIVKHASQSEAAPRLQALLELAQSEPGIPIAPTDFDRDPWLLNAQNGTIDLRSGELRPHRRTDLLSKIIPLDYDPDARCPRWEQFIDEITAGRPALGAFLQDAVGYSLSGDTRERAFFVGFGGGRNGKTKLYEAIEALLGPYAEHTPVQTLLAKRDPDRPANELAALRGVRFVSASEPAEGARFDVALVKALTGQDPITARFLFKEFFTYIPEFKIWLMTNHKPGIRETQDAIWDRVKLIPFEVRFYHPDEAAPAGAPRQDLFLDQKLRDELPGILRWAIEGCLLWQRDGLGVPEEVLAATNAYRAEMDILGAFLADICVVHERASVPSATLYTAYSTWCERSGEDKKSKIEVGKALAERGFSAKRVGKSNIDTWFGVGLRAENDGNDGPEPSQDDPGPPKHAAHSAKKDLPEPQSEGMAGDPSDLGRGQVPESISRAAHVRNPSRKVGSPKVARVAGHGDAVYLTANTELAAILPDLLAADALGLDVETTGLNPRRDRLRLVQLATRERVYLIDAAAVDLTPLAALLSHEAGPTLIGHNLSFDVSFLRAAGLPIPDGERLFDTMLASQVLDGGAQKTGAKVDDPGGGITRGQPATIGYHTLAAVAHRWLGQVLDKSFQMSDWSGPLTDEQLAYAARDCTVLLPLRDALNAALAETNLTKVAALEFAALPAVVCLEATGAPLDVAAWTAVRDEAAAELTTIDADLSRLLPGVNANAPAQVVRALAARGIMMDNAQEQTLRALTIGDDVPDPVVALLLRRKERAKRGSTYGDSYLHHVDPRTGRIHASYRQIGAASGRMACSQPNLQNIPREAAYRRCIRPGPGRVLVKADYAQIELRIAAQLTGDRALLAAFRAGEDLHFATAGAVLGRTPTTSDRQLAKALNFGLLYGMGAPRLRDYAASDYGVHLTEAEAERFRERFFQAYPGLRAWHRHQPDGVVSTRTLGDRVRRGVSRFTEKLNSPVQGTGVDILKDALARLWADRASVPSSAPVLVVHDEIVCEVDGDEAHACAAWLSAHMTAAGAALLTEVPVVVETHIVADWSGTPWQLAQDDAGMDVDR